ncbi:MAG: ArsA family ATPase [Deltaproteobacteria bacterium]|nr:ArsA family ATPase [Deltaproteobacteria bacterium]MBW2137439.1 ArsA family ATPase [Deltaproteobacteria bacterium]
MRIILFAGKGGVGKTSVAAATGISAAESGRRTLVMSLDIAHSLSDIFALKRNLMDQNRGKPLKVRRNLWIQELDVQEEIEKNWKDIHRYISTLFNTTGLDEVLAEELAILPGMEEVSLLLYINRYVKEEEYDAIVLDCAPTGESLRFISIPTTLEWYIRKIFKLERALARYVGPVASRLYDVPVPGDDYFDAIAYLFERLEGVDKVLTDPEVTTVRLVTNPEKIVLKETQRAFMYFCLYKMSVDGIVMNRVLPKDLNDEYFKGWKEDQARYMESARDYFNPIPIFTVHLYRGEVLGYESLRSLAQEIYGDRNPLDRFFSSEPYSLTKKDGEYHLTMKLPFVAREDIQIDKLGDELVIRIGTVKRHMVLPRQVMASKSVRAKLKGQRLSIHFKGDKHEGEERKREPKR